MIDIANQIALAWWGWMGPMLWQASLLILVVSLIDLGIRGWAWPQVRYALWLLVLVKLLIPPTWSLPSGIVSRVQPWAQQRVVQLWVEENGVPREEAAPVEAAPVAPAAFPATRPEERGFRPASAAGPVWQLYAVVVWALGMVAFSGLLLTRMVKLRRWHRAQKEKKTIPVWFHELMVQTARRMKLGRLPAIVFSEEAVTPAVYGVFRPVLLLPASYTDSLSREEAEHVLLHELAHLKRGDLWLHGLALLLQIVYWFNPLLVWVSRQMKHVREICCDLTIANILRDKTMKYRQTLLNTARELLTESLEPGMGLLGVFEEPFRLVARLRWLEKKSWLNRKWMAATVCVVVAVAVPCLLPMAVAEQPALEAATVPERVIERPAAASPERSEDEVYYVKEVTNAKDYFLLFERGNKVTNVNELWFGDRRAASLERDQTVMVDLIEGTVTFINHRNKTWLKTTHPVEMENFLGDEFQWRHPWPLTTGVVEELDGTMEILGKECKEYQVDSWKATGNKQVDFNTIKVWASTDMPFDVNLFYELIENKRRFANRDAEYRAQLAKLKGIQMALRLEIGPFWASKILHSEVAEITRRKPPAGLWSVPEGYTRKEQFTREDF
jgi:beta-lactamase regulating signal transducer with metallopeptidase domain